MTDRVVWPRRPEDLTACVAALREVHDSDGYPTRWRGDPAAWLTPQQLLVAWVAPGSSRLRDVGLASSPRSLDCSCDPRPAARGQRLGRPLISTCLADARQRGLGVVLDVVDERRSPAIALHERLGGQLVGTRPADWITLDGTRPQLRLYFMPPTAPDESVP